MMMSVARNTMIELEFIGVEFLAASYREFMVEAGCSILDVGCSILDTGFWILDARYRRLDTGYWMNNRPERYTFEAG
jgi:hypothetical protein